MPRRNGNARDTREQWAMAAGVSGELRCKSVSRYA
jgi:hypothetical protein